MHVQATTHPLDKTSIGKVATAFVVQAQNSIGLSAESSRAHKVAWIPGESAPSAPPRIGVTPGIDSAVVRWTPPADSGSPIDGYEVIASDGASPPLVIRTTIVQ